MLSRLVIKNIALITELELSLSGGMNVLSGETGAGKSIIVDAVNLVLGERADRELIRTGAEKAVVEAWFSGAHSVDDLLEEQQIEPEDELVISREISVSGKNVCRINGTLVTLSSLKTVSDRLVDIHGQHEHQSLLSEKNHMAMLDGFDGRIAEAAEKVAAAYSEYTTIQTRLKKLLAGEDRERRIDILNYQISEIRQANVTEGEEEDLQQQKRRMNATERLAEALGAAYERLYESEAYSALATLKDVSSRLSGIGDVDEKFETFAARADEAYYALEELSSDIRHELDSCTFDADELEQIEERLALIHSLTRKYGDSLVTGAFIRKAEQELADLMNSEALAQQLTEKHSDCAPICTRNLSSFPTSAARLRRYLNNRSRSSWPTLACSRRYSACSLVTSKAKKTVRLQKAVLIPLNFSYLLTAANRKNHCARSHQAARYRALCWRLKVSQQIAAAFLR